MQANESGCRWPVDWLLICRVLATVATTEQPPAVVGSDQSRRKTRNISGASFSRLFQRCFFFFSRLSRSKFPPKFEDEVENSIIAEKSRSTFSRELISSCFVVLAKNRFLVATTGTNCFRSIFLKSS